MAGSQRKRQDRALESIIRENLSLTNCVVIADTTALKHGKCVFLQKRSYSFSSDGSFRQLSGECRDNGRNGAGMEINIKSIDREIAEKAAKIRAEYKFFKTMDALHLATACLSGCDLVLTNDKQLKQFQEIKCVTVEELE